jgi:hypothetical protein
VKRLFQVAVFGASDAANKKVMAAIARVRGCELAVVPEAVPIPGLGDGHSRSCEYEVADGTLHARFYVRGVIGYRLATRAFYGLLGVDVVVFVTSGAGDAAAWREAKKTFKTYGQPLVLVAGKPVRGVNAPVLPASGAPLVDAIERAVIDGFRAKRIKGRHAPTPSPAYLARVRALVAAIDIAIAVSPRDMRRFHQATRASVLHPLPAFATVASLAQTQNDFFTYWNEAAGPHIETFWREVARKKLPFRRRDVVAEVLAKGRITNRGDYDTVTDLLGDKRISQAQRARLDRMLGAYAGC